MNRILPIAAMLLLVSVSPTALAEHEHDVIAFDAETDYGDAVHLKGQLFAQTHPFDDECPCPKEGAQVDFYVDGEYVGTDLTDEAGFADLLLQAPEDWHTGEHEILVQWDGDEDLPDPVTDTATLTIHPETTQVEAHDGYLEAQLLDDENEPLDGQPVTFTTELPGLGTTEICTAYTDGTGFARCLPIVGVGITQHATSYNATFNGTDDLLFAQDSASLL